MSDPILLKGKPVATAIEERIAAEAEALRSERGINPGIAVILVGDDPASSTYVGSKERASARLGFHSVTERLPAETPERDVLALVKQFNEDPLIHGILVQLPLPQHIDERKVIESIAPEKDVDGFHPGSVGRLVIGIPGPEPCTPAGIIEMIRHYKIETSGRHAVVVGRSNIVGKPVANMLLQKRPGGNAIVTVAHSAASDLGALTRQADILIVAIGRAGFITGSMVKEGAVVIDVGINRVEDATRDRGYRVVGDVDFDSVAPHCRAITPVPGGVGLMTIAMLMNNTLRSARGDFA